MAQLFTFVKSCRIRCAELTLAKSRPQFSLNKFSVHPISRFPVYLVRIHQEIHEIAVLFCVSWGKILIVKVTSRASSSQTDEIRLFLMYTVQCWILYKSTFCGNGNMCVSFLNKSTAQKQRTPTTSKKEMAECDKVAWGSVNPAETEQQQQPFIGIIDYL